MNPSRLTRRLSGATTFNCQRDTIGRGLGRSLPGARDGALALVFYLLVGGVGLSVFADGASGWPHLAGPTGGYIVGFVLAAGIVGWFADGGHLARLNGPGRDDSGLRGRLDPRTRSLLGSPRSSWAALAKSIVAGV